MIFKSSTLIINMQNVNHLGISFTIWCYRFAQAIFGNVHATRVGDMTGKWASRFVNLYVWKKISPVNDASIEFYNFKKNHRLLERQEKMCPLLCINNVRYSVNNDEIITYRTTVQFMVVFVAHD